MAGPIYEATLGELSLDTANQEKAWLSALSVPVNLSRSAKVVIMVSGVIEYRANQNFVLRLGVSELGKDPARWNEYRGANGSTGQSLPFAISQTLTLSAGEHTLSFMAYNGAGGPVVKGANMVVFVVEQ